MGAKCSLTHGGEAPCWAACSDPQRCDPRDSVLSPRAHIWSVLTFLLPFLLSMAVLTSLSPLPMAVLTSLPPSSSPWLS